ACAHTVSHHSLEGQMHPAAQGGRYEQAHHASGQVSLWEWGKSIFIALAIWMVVRTFAVEALRIPTGSMENTLLVGDFLFVTTALYGAEVPLIHARTPAIREPRRDEVVVFKSVDGDFAVVKRLIGIPGDTVAMVRG